MNGTITSQWSKAALVTNADGTDTIEPGIWIAVLLDEGKLIDGEPSMSEYKACAGQSEIDGKSTEEIKALLLERIGLARAKRWTPQIVPGPSDDLGVDDLTGPVSV